MKTILFVLAAASLGACATAPAREDTAPFASNRITVMTRGNGPDIILVPGLASHRDVWAAIADSLDERYRLHLVQVKGFAGLAPEANAEGPVSAPVAEELARYIRERNLNRPAVIGHSMGGSIAMMLAARHPESVGRLMVVDMLSHLGSVFAPGATPEVLRQTADQFRAQILADTAGSPGMLEQMFAGMTRVNAMEPMLLQGVRTTNRRAAANAFHELILLDLRPELSRITVPMTVLYVQPPGVQMPAEAFDRAMRDMYANASRARLVRVEDSYHFIQFDQPARVIAEIDALMRM